MLLLPRLFFFALACFGFHVSVSWSRFSTATLVVALSLFGPRDSPLGDVGI